MKTFVLLVSLIALVAAQSPRLSIRDKVPDFLRSGQCPNVDEKALWISQVPNHPRLTGTWYETARSENVFQLVKQCTRSDLSYDGPGFGFRHISRGFDANGKSMRLDGVTYPFTVGSNAETPHLSIQFDKPSFAAPFVILDTDYEGYLCMYSCTDYNGNFVSDFLHMWSRTPDMPQQLQNKCMAAYRNLGLDVSRLQQVTHGSTCDYENQDKQLL